MGFLTGPKKTKSEKQEKRLADRFGGSVTPGSGSGSVKGDVHTYSRAARNPYDLPREAMIEAKTTAKTQYTLKLSDLKKLEQEATARGRRPVFIIRINDEADVLLFESEYVLLPLSHYEALLPDDEEET